MKLFNALVGIILFCYASFILPATINGRFVIVSSDPSKTTMLLQINTDAGNAELGGATIVFNFNTSAISIDENPVLDVDYTFHTFSGGNYSAATITRPMINTIWVNIDLPFTNSNNGTTVAAYPEWTDIVTIHFNTVDLNESQNLTWLTSSPFWGIYDADNSTIWENGVFEDFPTSVEPITDLPTDYMLEQNYPNPFNPSTKIQFSVPYVETHRDASLRVTLKVFDILGNEVATLVDEEKAPGVYEVEFSAANLSSGIYIYRLNVSDFSDTKKMILLK
ncbi:MAG TPA: T9SS type A sorting domain-containing protein [Ignavibacteriaceae bacterium]|nr:T9SS type A sorting domain-containing protein [Ignavibacteriaceae bacterium]